MPNREKKVDGNVEGKYYVDTTCIGCGVCQESAPNNFRIKKGVELSIVHKQPENEAEEEACIDAMGSCPVEAIGDDGK